MRREKNLHVHLLNNLPLTEMDRFQRVENLVEAGMPDINYCIGGVEGWIESKAPKEPVRASTPLFGSNHRLSQNQLNWFLTQRNAGGRCFVYIRTLNRLDNPSMALLINGKKADYINEATMEELVAVSLWNSKAPVSPESWMEFMRCLIA